MRRIIGTVVAVAALGIAASTIPATAQHHGGAGGFHGGVGGFRGGATPSFGMARPGPGMGFAPGGNFAGRTFVNPGFRHGFRGDRRFVFGGFGGPFWYDYGPDYAYDYDFGYGNDCYALQRVFVAGHWRLRPVWICG